MDAEKAREYEMDVTYSGDNGSNCCDASMYQLGDSYIFNGGNMADEILK